MVKIEFLEVKIQNLTKWRSWVEKGENLLTDLHSVVREELREVRHVRVGIFLLNA